ncbi:MAG: glycosyltransferase family 4 protein [Betaproteobacteria bacterium]|nr:glycosyltransferase family 4 protein [Betaproteobacteria bacterium]
MRILLTVHRFLPEFSAGTEVLTFDTARQLVARGHQVSVFTGIQDPAPLADEQRFDRYVHEGIPVERFHYDRVPMGGQANIVELEYDNRFLAARFRAFLREFRPDLVHFFHLQKLSASPIDVCRELGVPTVMTPTDFWLVCPLCQLRLPDNSPCSGPDPDGVNCLRHVVRVSQPRGIAAAVAALPRRLLAAAVRGTGRGALARLRPASYVRALAARPGFLRERMNRIDRVLVPSRLMEQTLLRHGLAREKIVFTRFGINLAHLAPAPRPNDPRVLRVGYIGTLFEHKGVHLLVEALRALPGEPLELHLYGDAEEYPAYGRRLRTMAARDARIQFRGTFPNRRIGEVLASLDVLAVPSVWQENTPLVVYSAQASGCPVVATDVPGLSEVVRDGENGLLFPREDAGALAGALGRLCRDRALLLRLASSAPRPKSIEEYTDELVGLYGALIRSRREIQ